MKSFTSVCGKAIPLLIDDIDTDQIAPASLMRTLTPDYRTAMFGHQRANAIRLGKPWPFDRGQFSGAPILVTGRNFGCGSAREVAVWALAENGIRCIIALDFSTVFRESCLKNGILPVSLDHGTHAAFADMCLQNDGEGLFVVDLQEKRITTPEGSAIPFEFDQREREVLLNGIDDVVTTLMHEEQIVAWERDRMLDMPWLRKAGIP